ncbi:MAG TPA: hypothetical protein VFA33_18085 [Bryobacteraceae bacterium]|nr:hypothetical protein [Bryobacteraceae bacterium]
MRRVISILGMACAIWGWAPASAQQVEVISEVKHDVSPPLRVMAAEAAPLVSPQARPLLLTPAQAVPGAAQADPVVQENAGAAVATTPGLNILGLGNGFVGPNGTFQVQYAPPDTNAAVGATQVVETVNISYAVFDKNTGSPTLGPLPINTIWSGFGGNCATTNLSDPVVLYDQLANRWVVEIITVSSPYLYCVAVSTTSDATGSYNRYAFQETIGLPDYAKVGIWPDAYYLSSRMFTNAISYAGPRACALNRAAMLAGSAATMQCFQISNTSIDGMLPASLDGSTPPPAGVPNTYVVQGPSGSNQLYLFKLHVDFTTPSNSKLAGPLPLAVAAYTPAPSSGGVPQSGTTQRLDALGNFLMHRLAYRNFPAANPPHESLVATHSVIVGSSLTRRVGVRWYELRNISTKSPTIFQQGTFSPDTTFRWMGSIAMDKAGDIALGYSASSSSINPAIRYTGRIPTDAAGTMEAEATIFQGNGSQSGRRLSRWGDYTSMSVDPSDGCTMWYANEYIPVTGAFNWSTRLFSFKFSACQ